MSTKKVVAWTCWSNERSITEPGQCGVLHGRLFVSAEAAKAFYIDQPYHSSKCDVLVKVTVERDDPAAREEGK